MVTPPAAMREGPWSRLWQFRFLTLVVLLAWSVGLAACSAPVASTTEVVDLASVSQLAGAFNDVGSDTPKLILLLSPT